MSGPRELVVAALQMASTQDRQANLRLATELVEQAARRGAGLIVLPEFFNGLGRLEEVAAAAEPIPGPTSEAMRRLASRLGIVLVAGSICEASSEPGKGYNTSLAFGPDGQELGRYRKLHLFDVELDDGVSFCESAHILPGNSVSVWSTTWGTCGQATCYDLRFPALFHTLADGGAELIAFPSAFLQQTGQAHWEVLLRARAIENQTFVVAANQCGQHAPRLTTYGHSLIADPWGNVLANAGAVAEGIALATIDLARVAEIRQQLPTLKHRRTPR